MKRGGRPCTTRKEPFHCPDLQDPPLWRHLHISCGGKGQRRQQDLLGGGRLQETTILWQAPASWAASTGATGASEAMPCLQKPIDIKNKAPPKPLPALDLQPIQVRLTFSGLVSVSWGSLFEPDPAKPSEIPVWRLFLAPCMSAMHPKKSTRTTPTISHGLPLPKELLGWLDSCETESPLLESLVASPRAAHQLLSPLQKPLKP